MIRIWGACGQCSNSITQIQHTYHHLNDTIRLNNAVADYRLDSDVTIRLV
ncbi:MAG: hypothetical protein VXY74_07315 [SAR324 cluster bacterium]|nr:hypothetical protein [SAR324 cluster bacterium]MEC8594600.1 hypothetical protein [SAR324 cluster bacterium]